MPLECVMLVVDNTKYSRNSDIYPSRFDAQLDLYTSISRQKDNDNPETLCGIMTAAGPKGVILMDPNEPRKINSVYKNIVIDYESVSFLKSLKMAALCLNNRINKNQKQRIIFTICSPIIEKDTDIMKLAKDLRRNNVAVDVYNLNQPGNNDILTKFNDIVNNDNNSKYVNINEYIDNLTNYISRNFSNNTNTNEGGFNDDNDDNMDEELKLAIKMSIEAENKRKEEEEKRKKQTKDNTETKETNTNTNVKDKEFLKDVLSELKLKDDDEEIKKLINEDDDNKDNK